MIPAPPPTVSTPPVSPDTEEELLFERRPMVKWFSPGELVRAGVKAVLSKLFGDYADNREIQALRPDPEPQEGDDCAPCPPEGGGPIATADYTREPREKDELWLDYVADLGDGFAPTYAIARLLAAPTLQPETPSGTSYETERGRVLVMGGDQVYPTATREEYQNRLAGPYRAALPWVSEREKPPHLYAIPGNHDWYDGLTSFTRLFCQGRWIGGWKTRQSRSYFALQLPHGWWLWGIDIQLGADVDEPQLRYFEQLARTIPAGAKIILCVAEPAWVEAEREGPEAYASLAAFEARTMGCDGHEHHFVVGLAGDLHAYARYRDGRGRQRFVSGGGGAYLYPTHTLPQSLSVPSGALTDQEREREGPDEFWIGTHGDSASSPPASTDGKGTGAEEAEQAFWPSRSWSRLQAFKSILLARYNPGFAFFFGAYYLLIVWLVESASRALAGTAVTATFLASASEGFIPMLACLKDVLPLAPGAAVATLVLWLGLWAFAVKGFASKGHTILKGALGIFHTTLHLAALGAATYSVMRLISQAKGEFEGLGDGPDDLGILLLFTVLIGGLSSILAGIVWGVYLLSTHALLANRWIDLDVHSNDVLACQSRSDYKHLLRLHITKEALTVYPIGIESVPKWTYKGGRGNGEPWFEPDDDGGPFAARARLLEPPIRVVWPSGPESEREPPR